MSSHRFVFGLVAVGVTFGFLSLVIYGSMGAWVWLSSLPEDAKGTLRVASVLLAIIPLVAAAILRARQRSSSEDQLS
jgi:membrane protein implicated in regulation of membrane protease activity